MKILKPILYCLLGAILASGIIYFMKDDNCELELERNNTVVKNKEVSIGELFITSKQLEIYNQITLLINSIMENGNSSNNDLVRLLDKLRNNLNYKRKIKSLIIAINKEVEDGGINIESKQQEKLDSILDNLGKGIDTVSIGVDGYEKYIVDDYIYNKLEILVMLPTINGDNIRADIEGKFNKFEDNAYIYSPEEKAEELEGIRNTIIDHLKKHYDSDLINDYTQYFCNIFNYFDLKNKKCNN